MEKKVPHTPKLYKLLFVLFLLPFFIVNGQSNDTFLILKKVLDSVSIYDSKKVQNIEELSSKLNNLDKDNLEERYNLSQQLFEQYVVFQKDSAFQYALIIKNIADSLKVKHLQNKASINLADICVSGGMYKEGFDFLRSVDTLSLTKETASLFYGLMGRCYSDMAEYSNVPYFSEKYNKLAKIYRNKALELTETGTFYNNFLQAFNRYMDKDYPGALGEFKSLLKNDVSSHDLALTNFMIGELYNLNSKADLAVEHFTIATIYDVKTSTKESLAMIRLSELLFKKKDLVNASTVINKAYEDALFYGAQQRKLQIGAILPLIEQEIVKNIERERKRLYWQYITVMAFLIVLVCFTIIIFMQVKRLKKAKILISKAHNELQKTNKKLVKVNRQVKENNKEIGLVNKRLNEANKIKEEYLGFFFTEYDDIFEKFNELTSNIEYDIQDENYDKVRFHLSRYNLGKEKEKLLRNFDTAFIKLFPNFVQEFNSLMKEGQEIKLKNNQILTKELRIFALIKLGITHNDKIAQILGYSVNSIYAYKTKIRNQSIIENENFDLKLIENTSIKI